MPPTLATAREAFIRQMYRDNGAGERQRLLAVLDAVIAWSAAHATQVRFRPDDNTKGVIRFENISTNTVLLMISPRRENVPLLQLLPGSGRLLSDEERTDVVTRLNSYTREENPFERMHIGFGALKNAEGRAAVFALLDEVLQKVQRAEGTAAPVA
jgi:hypothetical protein